MSTNSQKISLVLALLLLFLAIPFPARAAATPVVISLEFDDGTVTQKAAAEILQRYGLRGTFYVNSSRIGAAGFLDGATLCGLQAAGHEIGGHTASHVDLGLLTTTGRTEEIAGDKRALEALGLKVSNFSYPFGSYNTEIMNITKAAGYHSARTVGGIGYGEMRPAESLPPRLLYATETLPSVKGWDTLATLEGYVTKAELSGGGWLQFVFHHVDNTGQQYSVSPQTLEAFASWISNLKSQGTVVVKTVEQAVTAGVVIPDPLPIPEPTPPPAPEPPPVIDPWNLIINKSFEVDRNGDGLPDYWEFTGWGETVYRYERVTPGYDGNWAQRVEILSGTGGERKIISTQKDLANAPNVVGGRGYKLSAWYKSSTPMRFVLYYRANNRWNWLSESSYFNPTENWRQAEWTVTLPASAQKVSVGALIKKVGWLTIDSVDFRLAN